MHRTACFSAGESKDLKLKKDSVSDETKIHSSVFIASTATVIGDVSIGRDSSVWFNAVIRGDSASIVIGEGTNVQDSVVIHTDVGSPTTIGSRVTIAHGAIVHGAMVANDVLIGIGAIVLSRAHIGEYSVIAAGSLIPEGTEIPPRSLVMGVPGKIIRQVSDTDIERIQHGAHEYAKAAKNYQKGIHTLG
jgi:carbonic anhydrase/acetyltransferase-like protein (isoleucine patch superfamily)